MFFSRESVSFSGARDRQESGLSLDLWWCLHTLFCLSRNSSLDQAGKDCRFLSQHRKVKMNGASFMYVRELRLRSEDKGQGTSTCLKLYVEERGGIMSVE